MASATTLLPLFREEDSRSIRKGSESDPQRPGIATIYAVHKYHAVLDAATAERIQDEPNFDPNKNPLGVEPEAGSENPSSVLAGLQIETKDLEGPDSQPPSAFEHDLENSPEMSRGGTPSGIATPEALLEPAERVETQRDFLRATNAPAPAGGGTFELARRVSTNVQGEALVRTRSSLQNSPIESTFPADAYQAVPPQLGSLWKELIFVLICTFGQLLFSFLLGSVTVTQSVLIKTLGISNAQAPWLVGSFLLANGLSVVISGSLADLANPRLLMVGAFVWLTIWNTIGSFSFTPSRAILFFVTRGMQGLSVGVLVSTSMSILGRIYKPGTRKPRVFSGMAAGAPFGFWLGCLQGGALASHLPWIFGSNALLCGICSVAAYLIIPPLTPARDSATSAPPSMRNFDYLGAALAVSGCGCLLFGLTQGTTAAWAPYTYSLVILGLALLITFYFAEGYVARPLVPKTLWSTPGFTPLVIAYFLSFGSYVGAWQYYAVQFFLNIRHASPLTTALYLTPNVICGVLATWIVSRTLHVFAGHVILAISMLAYALGPVFFLPQTPSTTYWALSMPGIALVTFGPDLAFAAASIFVTSQVPKSYQGSAGSLLVTVQNLSAAVMTAIGGTIGEQVGRTETGEIGLEGLRAVWWFGLALAVAAGVVVVGFVRIPKSVEKDHAM